MKTEISPWKCLVSFSLILALMFAYPAQAVAQSNNRSNVLDYGAPVVLSISETVKMNNSAENGLINATVNSDVYSADGSRVLIKAGTPATVDYSLEQSGSWGKAGRVCMTNATTKTIDNKRVSLRLSTCEKGGSRIGGVIVLSVLFFPIGLLSGLMKGSNPQIEQGTVLNTTVSQEIVVE
ncbi:MAG: hypothetical protein HDS65_08440 [Bacteroidales bacterium]|nr:hypothetical protein [Bacteroidales bacterium]